MKRFLSYLSLALLFLILLTKCNSKPPGVKTIRLGKDTVQTVERSKYFNLLEGYEEFSCFLLSESSINMVDSVKTTYVKGKPDLQEVYFNGGTEAVYISNFQIKDLNVRDMYNTFLMSKTKPDSVYYEKWALDVEHKGVSKHFEHYTGEWLYFNDFLKDRDKEPLTYNTFLIDIKDINKYSLIFGFPWDISTRLGLIFLMFVVLILIFFGRFSFSYKVTKESPENTG